MSDHDFEKQSNIRDLVENTNKDTNNPVDSWDPFADRNPVDAALIHQTPMGGTVAAVGPMRGTPPEEILMFETPQLEIPMGGTLAAVGPMNEPLVDEIPTLASPDHAPLAGETFAEEIQVSQPIPYKAPMGETATHAPVGANAGSLTALLTPEESRDFRTRWNEIQGRFVDEPRSAVQEADGLVSEVIEKITQMFAHKHSSLEGQWKQGNDVSTEDLRKALQHYRSFFNRLMV